MNVRIGILVGDKLGATHVVVPHDIWKKANFIVELISVEKKNTIVLESGVKISCQHNLDKTNLSQYNAIYIPGGGDGYKKFIDDKIPASRAELYEKIKFNLSKDFRNKNNKWILGSCSSPKVLKDWDLAGNNKMTGSSEIVSELGDNYTDASVCVSGNIITSDGIGSLFDFALKVVDILANDNDASKEICQTIKYERANT